MILERDTSSSYGADLMPLRLGRSAHPTARP